MSCYCFIIWSLRLALERQVSLLIDQYLFITTSTIVVSAVIMLACHVLQLDSNPQFIFALI